MCGCVSGEKRFSGESLVDVSILSVPSLSVQCVSVGVNLIKNPHRQKSHRGKSGLSWKWLLAGPCGDECVCVGCTRVAAGACKCREVSSWILSTEKDSGPVYLNFDSGTKYRANRLRAAASHRHMYEH